MKYKNQYELDMTERKSETRKKMSEEENKLAQKKSRKKYYEKNKTKILKKLKTYREKNKDKIKKYREENKEYIRKVIRKNNKKNQNEIISYNKEYRKEKYHSDEYYKRKYTLKSYFVAFTKGNYPSFSENVGCTPEEFKAHITSLLPEGYDWSNYKKKWRVGRKNKDLNPMNLNSIKRYFNYKNTFIEKINR